MKHILYFFDAWKGSRIDLFGARSDIYVVNFDLFDFILLSYKDQIRGNVGNHSVLEQI